MTNFIEWGTLLIISLSFKHLEVSLAYALWSGVGGLLVLGCGVLLFKESLSLSKLLFFALIMMGVVGLSFAPYLDAAGGNVLGRLARRLDGKVPRFGNYFIGFSVLSFLVLGNPVKASSQIEQSSFIFGSLVATIVLSLVLVFFLVLLQSGLSLLIALLASAALWLVVMVMTVPGG